MVWVCRRGGGVNCILHARPLRGILLDWALLSYLAFDGLIAIVFGILTYWYIGRLIY